MGNPFGSKGYFVDKERMGQAEDNLFNQTGQGFAPGSSGYNAGQYGGGAYGVNPNTGRSFTTLPQYSDYVKEGSPENAFSGIANAQKTAMQRGLAGGNRGTVSQFGQRGLGLSGAGGALAANRANTSRGMADIQRQNKMGQLNYGTDMYKYNRGQALAEELGLRNARQGDNTGMRNDYLSNLQGTQLQYAMDSGMNNQMYNQYAQTYGLFNQNADQGTSGWVSPMLEAGGAAIGGFFGNAEGGGQAGDATGRGLGEMFG
jgi:hypothetical protein